MKTDETHGGKTEMTQRNPLLFFWLKICWGRVFSMTLVRHKLFAFAASSLFLDKDLIICVKLLLWTVRLGSQLTVMNCLVCVVILLCLS